MAVIVDHALGGLMNHVIVKPPQGGGPASATWETGEQSWPGDEQTHQSGATE